MSLTFTDVEYKIVGKRREPGYEMKDNEGNTWQFVLEKGKKRSYLAFLKVPTKYKPLLGLATSVNIFKDIEEEGLKAIERYNIMKNLSPETKDSFEGLLGII
jgi:hypothetical protein